MNYDACRSTDQFLTPGQLISMSYSTPTYMDLNTNIQNAVNQWYNQYQAATQADIDNCCGGANYNNIGQFLSIMQDKSTAIGCAISRFTTQSNGYKTTYIVCNVAKNNLQNTPVYVAGPSASQCSSVDSTFPNLCAYIPTTIAPITTTTPLMTTVPTTDYCSVCSNHIACNNPGNWYPACPADAKMVILDTDMRNLIVHTHNTLRNKVASGNQVGYNSATKMYKMVSFLRLD